MIIELGRASEATKQTFVNLECEFDGRVDQAGNTYSDIPPSQCP